MKRVLFVDDQPEVLRGLQRMLDHMAEEWDMQFATSGQVALEAMEDRPFDVIVSDMQMPGMDGAQLLDHVSASFPETVRIILSGEADRDAVFRAVRPMHQYLSKPCEAAALTGTVERACALNALLAAPALTRLVAKTSSLPSLPALYTELVREIESPEGSVQCVGEIISRDLGMTTKILQLANSTLFGLRREVTSPAQAASLLGLETIKTLVLSLQVFSEFKSQGPTTFSLDALMNHSVLTGSYARTIVKEAVRDAAIEEDTLNQAFTAGMLHDVGKLVLASVAAEEYRRAWELAAENGMPLVEAEQQILGATHAAVGAYLLGLWGLPQPIVEAAAFHHTLRECGDRQLTLVTAVHVANGLAHETAGEEQLTCLDREYLNELQLDDRLAAWRQACNIAPPDESNE